MLLKHFDAMNLVLAHWEPTLSALGGLLSVTCHVLA